VLYTVTPFLLFLSLTCSKLNVILAQEITETALQQLLAKENMTVKLKNIASVQMGQSFRTRLEPDSNGNVSVIQMKDLTEDNSLNSKKLVRIEMQDLKPRHRVEQNDLAFRSRGKTNTAALMNTHFGNAVIAAPLLRIRVENPSVIPAYLCWFINQPSSQAALQSKATGTAMRMIGKPALQDLELVLPSLEIQKKIIALSALSLNEQKLMKALSEKKGLLINGILMQLAENTPTRQSPE
jgi:restriction endonuclease S subunit